MCIGDSGGDTLQAVELSFLEGATHRQIPGYRPAAHDNGATAWMVLEPTGLAGMPRFTICRIAPCIMVQIELADERRFVSVASLEDAIVVAQRAVSQTQARQNVHRAPALAQ